jgi:hypothetical protein
MPLSDVSIRRARPADKPLRLFDGGGLYLEISPTLKSKWVLDNAEDVNMQKRWIMVWFCFAMTSAFVLSNVLFAPSIHAQEMSPDSFPSGANVTYRKVPPNKLEITMSRPTNGDDAMEWADFVRAAFRRNVSPTAWPGGWPVLVGQSELATGMQERENSVFKDWIRDRRLRPGDILALGGPSSRVTADTMIKSFGHAPPNWAKGATLMFMGSLIDKDRVFAALRSSGATLRFFDLDSVQALTFEHNFSPANGPTPQFSEPPPPPGAR